MAPPVAPRTGTPEAKPTPVPRTRRPTGNAIADAAIAAIEAKDVTALLALMRYDLQPCGLEHQLSGPAACPAGVAPGTPVEAFVLTGCDGTIKRHSEAEELLTAWVRDIDVVYGAYHWTPRASSDWDPGGVIVVATAVIPPNGVAGGRHLYYSDDRARGTWVAFGCGPPVATHMASLATSGPLVPLGVAAGP